MSTTTTPPGSVVVGVDGSPQGDLALTWAAAQASLEHRPLSIVMGVGLGGPPWIDAYGIDQARLTEETRAAGHAMLAAARSRVEDEYDDVEVHTHLVFLDPRTALIDHAATAHLLVVGSRGRGPVARLVLGSVSAAVSRLATCPVVVVRPTEADLPDPHVLVGVDGHGGSGHVLELAYDLACVRHLPLEVLHTYLGVEGSPEHEEERLVLAETVAGMGEKYPDVVVTLSLEVGLAADLLVRAARHAGTVVVGGRHHGLVDALFSAEVDRVVVTSAPAVVVVVPHPVVV